MHIMPKLQNPRVSISPEAFQALNIQAAIEGRSIVDVLSNLVMKNLSPEARRAIDAIQPERQIVTMAKHPECGMSDVAEKRPKLSANPDALSRIQELWLAGEHNSVVISQDIGYPRATTWENIKRLRDQGKLI